MDELTRMTVKSVLSDLTNHMQIFVDIYKEDIHVTSDRAQNIAVGRRQAMEKAISIIRNYERNMIDLVDMTKK